METSQEKKESIKTDKITGKRRFLKMYVFVCLFWRGSGRKEIRSTCGEAGEGDRNHLQYNMKKEEERIRSTFNIYKFMNLIKKIISH